MREYRLLGVKEEHNDGSDAERRPPILEISTDSC
jgi:hypothetical protein